MVAIGADEKKKLFILGGLAGLLILVVLFVIKPFGGGSADDAAPADTTATAPAPTDVQPISTEGVPLPAASAPVAATGSPTTIGIVNPRTDPFAPKFIRAVAPPPPPPPPVSLPAPDPASALPLRPLPPGLSLGQPLNLPPTRIPQYRPRQAPRSLTGATIVGSASSGAQSALDKRLAGVAIGDSVRALLEINDGVQTITRVVQPGDEVEGIRILRIERVTDAGNTVTRMFISQNGQEQFVDLRPSSNPIAAPDGMPGGGL